MRLQSVLINSPLVGKESQGGLLGRMDYRENFYKSVGCSILLEL